MYFSITLIAVEMPGGAGSRLGWRPQKWGAFGCREVGEVCG